MPTYEMTCRECGERSERFLTRLLRDEDKVCSACGSGEVVLGVGGGFCAPRRSGSDSACLPRGGFG